MSEDSGSVEDAAEAASVMSNIATAATTLLPLFGQGVATSAVILIQFFGDIELYKFINVPFPNNFITFCNIFGNDLLPNLFSLAADSESDEGVNSEVGMFKVYEVSTIFLDNTGTNIYKEIIALLVILITTVIMASTATTAPRVTGLMSKVRKIFMWNTVLTYFVSDLPEFMLYIIIEFQQDPLVTSYGKFSCSVSGILTIGYAGMLACWLSSFTN